MSASTMTVALVSDVFFSADGGERLLRTLTDARDRGADIALLPELPLNRWAPAGPTPSDEDAEPPAGPRHRLQAEAARDAGIGLVGGAIVRDPATGRRYNTALVFDAAGRLLASYRKLHLPEEDGFWETAHYEVGDEPPPVIRDFPVPFGVQICSDSHRPEGSHLLAALGAEAIFVPRATDTLGIDRWRLVLTANACTSTAYVLSTTRHEPGLRIPLGGPALAIAPDRTILVETEERLAFVTLDRSVVERARSAYPGYLPVRADVYARGWASVGPRDAK